MGLNNLESAIGLVITSVGITTVVVSWLFLRYVANITSKAEAEKAKLELENAKLVNAIENSGSAHVISESEQESAKQLQTLAQQQKHLASSSETRQVVSSVGTEQVPLFTLPRCLPEDLKKVEGAHHPTLYVVAIENEIETKWEYDERRNVARLFFNASQGRKLAAEVLLDVSDSHELAKEEAYAGDWFLYVVEDEGLSVLKIQFHSSEHDFVSLYWSNYAIERYLESKIRELTYDWDFDVTLGQFIGVHVGKQDPGA